MKLAGIGQLLSLMEELNQEAIYDGQTKNV